MNIECKNPTNPAESSYTAYRQIKTDYEKNLPEFYKYVQIGIAACETAWYFPIVPWCDEVKKERWKHDSYDTIDSIIEMLSSSVLLDMIGNFIFIREDRTGVTKVIARYMQFRAVNKIVERVLRGMNGYPEPNQGLIWHWQGSGKTLEMIFAANKIFKALGNPTIFFVVDRENLQDQLYNNFTALNVAPLPEKIDSIKELVSVLKHGEGAGKRGIFIASMQKFREDIQELKDTAIVSRKDIIVFADEGHRTQYGSCAAVMRSILKNAFFFAFTGTPLKKEGRDTYETFSNLPNEKYLDKYFMLESISDNFTLKIAYQPRLENKTHLNKEQLNSFLEQDMEELPEEIREDIKTGVKNLIKTKDTIIKNPERIKLIAKDIAKHFMENIDNKFKAMVVAIDRETCVIYKKELDKFLPKEYSEVVMTFNKNDNKRIITDYLNEMQEKYRKNEADEINKDIINKFNEEPLPKILIVTEMLLTGFDSPILQTMYLDKLLKEHRLLQAVARTNRPYDDVKTAGVVIDYIGILKEYEKAIGNYTKNEIKGALYNMEELKSEFRDMINKILEIFKHIPKDYNKATLDKVFELLTNDEGIAKEFLRKYRKLRKAFELLGPDILKAELFSEYKWISAIFIYYRRMVDRRDDEIDEHVKKYFERTLKHVYSVTELEKIKENLPVIKFDEDYLTNLEKKIRGKKERAADIVFTLNKYVLVEKYKDPVYESVADKVEKIFRSWKERTANLSEIYSRSVDVVNEISTLRERQKKLSMSDMEYSVLLVLEKDVGGIRLEDIKILLENIKSSMFKNWTIQASARKSVAQEIVRFLRKHQLTKEERDDIYEKIIRQVENYGKEN